MYISIAVVSALAATVAANTVYSTVDVTITSCGPAVTSCPGRPAPPASNPPAGGSHPASVSVPTSPLTPTTLRPSSSAPPAPPASSIRVSPSSAAPPASSVRVSPSAAAPPAGSTSRPAPPPSAGFSSAASGPATGVAPYPSSVITVVSSSRGPVGTGTGVVPPRNATSTLPPIPKYTGAASSFSASFGALAGLAAIAAFMA